MAGSMRTQPERVIDYLLLGAAAAHTHPHIQQHFDVGKQK